ncbi:MAG: hypothetical protein FRX48_03710 [Lasallia pustulata]|uniref:Uncharacterized protein n=1 Tax=Lasallia pustulata TaxID=136370 RepID=A0A5M8PT09_9LECA|nr:MAG: hypothetical protein FRX48_03710 [Lasallia pustulata]
MRFSTAAIALFVSQFAVPAAASCNANNCLRAIIASAFTTRHGSADCSSFLQKTITPATSTITASTAVSTATATVILATFSPNKRDAIPVSPPALALRQVTAPSASIPAYASACSGTSAYSSACSCIGVTPTTTTLPTPTTTITVSYTSTATTTECARPLPTFALQVIHTFIVYNGTPIDTTYATIDHVDPGNTILGAIAFDGAPLSAATYFSLNAQNQLVSEAIDTVAVSGKGEQFSLVYFSRYPYAYSQEAPAVCTVTSGVLLCETLPGVDLFQLCPGRPAPENLVTTNDLYIGSTVQDGCAIATLNVIPVCMVPAA